jgi:hypothetical protein
MGSQFFTRRALIGGTGATAFAATLGMPIPFARFLPEGLIPVALAQDGDMTGKQGLTILGDRPLNAETPVHLLDQNITSGKHMFVRNNGLTQKSSRSRSRSMR